MKRGGARGDGRRVAENGYQEVSPIWELKNHDGE
jgi:hypothetical protein